MHRIVVADPRPQFSHAGHRSAKIVLHPWRNIQAELLGMPQIGPGPCRAYETFRRHTADIQAVAAHEMPFDQRDFRADAGSDHRRHQTRRSRPNHDQIVPPGRLRIDPARRMHVLDQLPIMLIVGEHQTVLMPAHWYDPR